MPAAVWLAGTKIAALIGPLARNAPAGFLFSGEEMELDFEKENGLIPAIVQDHANGAVLMLGF
ncbi:MAG TPA: hypothetical protein VI216_03420, partial [Candidatus Acidoferrales bacterium]